MYDVLMFIHWLGAVAMGFYLLLPFLVGKTSALSGSTLSGYTSSLYGANRIAQFLLIAQLLTGGYLMSQGQYPHSWMAVVVVVLIAIGAISGVIGANLKRLQQSAGEQANDSTQKYVGKIKTFSWVLAVLFVVMLILMYHPSITR